LLNFDNGESLKANTIVRDASGHKHGGRVLVDAGGSLRKVAGVRKAGASFPKRCHGCGRAIIELPDRKGLDPNLRQFVFGASIRVGPKQTKHGENVFQKGYFHQQGGQWKLQLLQGGVPSCVVFGGRGRLRVDGTASVADGHWHRLRCTRLVTGVSLSVDGVVVDTVAGPTGHINSAAPARVGGKKVTARNQQFHGRIDTIVLRMLPSPA
jgi:Concanavalin A-like lectin/glucanases superfamily